MIVIVVVMMITDYSNYDRGQIAVNKLFSVNILDRRYEENDNYVTIKSNTRSFHGRYRAFMH